MAQFYLLSIFANIVAGLTLAGDYLGDRIAFLSSFKSLRENRTAQIVIGIVTAVIGVTKWFVRSPGEGLIFVGDLLPGLAGVILGGILLVEAFRTHIETRGEKVTTLSKAVLSYRVPVGIAGVAIALLHFLFPGAVIL